MKPKSSTSTQAEPTSARPRRARKSTKEPSPVPDAKRKRVKKSQEPKELKWNHKEKTIVLEALTQIKEPKIPDDLLEIQRKLCKRSVSEIETYLNGLVKPVLQRRERNAKVFADTNLKKWINGCDRLTGLETSCSKTGSGVIEVAHPALAVADVFAKPESIDKYEVLDHGDSTALKFEWENVYWFIEKVMKGSDPLDEWSCRRKLESAVIIELLDDLLNSVKHSSFDRQQEFFFNKYRESSGAALSPPYTEQAIPDNLFDSKFLNPLGMSEDLCQGVETPSNPQLIYYQNLLRKEKHSGSAE